MTASAPLARTTCLIHPNRPAAARCPSCGAFFCTECITEHDGRLTCARCLVEKRQGREQARRRERRFVPLPALQLIVGLVLIWLLWYGIAMLLLSIPADFHDGTIWR